MHTGIENERIAADFDEIAALEGDGISHNLLFHRFILKQLPGRVERLLDVGCGKGELLAAVRARAGAVVGIDLSPAMLLGASGACAPPKLLLRADLLAAPFLPESLDAIVSIATLHHVPLGAAVCELTKLLRPGGTLVVVDLFQASPLRAVLTAPFAFGLSGALRLINNGSLRMPRHVREAWDRHATHDVYPTLPEVRAVAKALLPGARVRAHLLWRYSIVWRKPHG